MDVLILPIPTSSRAFRTRRQSLFGPNIILVLVLCALAIEITTVKPEWVRPR